MRWIVVISFVVVLAAAAIAVGAGSGDDDPAGKGTPPEPATESGRAHMFDVEQVVDGLNRPTYVGAAPGDPDALWVLEQPGRVLRLEGEESSAVVDLSDRVKTGSEQGLLGIAFHPDFATNETLYLHFSDSSGDTRVVERIGDDERELLHVEQPEENHNGGQLAFGPDGRLYIGLGDGGGGFDPRRTAQDPDSRLGKLLSADVRKERPEWRVEMLGLRNPWRFSFDFALGEIWIADVGQNEIEEIDRVLLEPDEPPKNLGWSVYEGDERVPEGDDELAAGEVVWPVAIYHHGPGCSVTGGYLYRGTDLPELRGRYLYGDFCSGELWSLKPTPEGGATDVRREEATVPQLSHIGPDADGEPVFASSDGAIYRAIAPAPQR